MIEDRNRRMLRARDTMDRAYAQPLDIPALARVAHVSPAYFSRQFRVTFGETPHRYLQRRRVERAMELLRETDRPITEICFDVGFASLGTFSRTFRAVPSRRGSAGQPLHRQTARGSSRATRFYGTDCALRDPFGNSIRFTQPPDGPIVVPTADELGAQL
jgi:AraC-like DNA-binding protein